MSAKIVPIIGTVTVSDSPYQGEYTVTPKRQQQVLATANKTLTEDVTVVAIPHSEVSNLVGGTTYYIAREN